MMLDPMIVTAAWACAALVPLLVLWRVATRTFVTISHGEAMVVERMGQYHATLTPGFHMLLPLLDRPKAVHWSRDEYAAGAAHRVEYELTRIPMLTQTYDPPIFESTTRDKYNVQIDTIMVFRIADARKAVYSGTDLYSSMERTLDTAISGYVIDQNYQQLMENYAGLTTHVLKEMNIAQDHWGIEIESLRIQRIEGPKDLTKIASERIVAVQRAEQQLQTIVGDSRVKEAQQAAAAEHRRREQEMQSHEQRARIDFAKAEQTAKQESERAAREHTVALEELSIRVKELERRGLFETEAGRLRALLEVPGMTSDALIQYLSIRAQEELARSPHQKLVLPAGTTDALGLQALLNGLVGHMMPGAAAAATR